MPDRKRCSPLTLRQRYRQPALAGLFVFAPHVVAGSFHDANDAIETDDGIDDGVKGKLSRAPSLGHAHGVPFDAGCLDETFDRIAGEPKVVLYGDLGCVLHLPVVSAVDLA